MPRNCAGLPGEPLPGEDKWGRAGREAAAPREPARGRWGCGSTAAGPGARRPPWLRGLVAVAGMWVLRRRGDPASGVPGGCPPRRGLGGGWGGACLRSCTGAGLTRQHPSDRLAEVGRVGMDRGGGARLPPWRMQRWRLVGPAAVFPGSPDSVVGQDEPLARGKDLEPRGGGRMWALLGQGQMGFWVQTLTGVRGGSGSVPPCAQCRPHGADRLGGERDSKGKENSRHQGQL